MGHRSTNAAVTRQERIVPSPSRDTQREKHPRDVPVHCAGSAGSPAAPAAASGRGHRHCLPLGVDGNPAGTGGEVGNESHG